MTIPTDSAPKADLSGPIHPFSYQKHKRENGARKHIVKAEGFYQYDSAGKRDIGEGRHLPPHIAGDPIKQYTFDFGVFDVHPRYVISEVAEGSDFRLSDLGVLLDHIQGEFDGDYGYISNRVNSYSLDPIMWSALSAIRGLKAYALVWDGSRPKSLLQDEMVYRRALVSDPDFKFSIFTTLEDAINWIELTLDLAPRAQQKPFKGITL